MCVLIACNHHKQNNDLTDKKKTEESLKAQKIATYIRNADSVLLISHAGREYKRSKTDTFMPVPPIVINKSLNDSIIFNRVKLDANSSKELAAILTSPANEDSIILTMCEFDPHYSIAFFNHEKISYLSICFACMQIVESKGLDFSLELDLSQWRKLNAIFSSKGIRKK